MQQFLTPKAGEGASVSRRKFMAFAAAGSAATLPAVALAEASGKTSRLPQPPEIQLAECVAQLRAILAEMHPGISVMHDHRLSSRPDGSFRFSLQGDVSFQSFQGDGVYIISHDGHLHEYLVREERIFSMRGRDLGHSHYWGRIRCEDGGWCDHERFVCNFVRKVGEVPA